MKKCEYDLIIFFPKDYDHQEEIYSWAQEFSRYLDLMLNKLLGYRPTILLSPDIDTRTKLLNRSREDIIAETALFLFLIDDNSLQDTTYQKEIDTTLELLEFKRKDPLKHLFKIELKPTPGEQQHTLLKRIIPYHFYELNSFSKNAITIDLTFGTTPDDKFWTRLLDMSTDIMHALEISSTGNSNNNQKSIYLAQTTPDQYTNYNIIRRELQLLGYKVVPENLLPNNAVDYRKKMLVELSNCETYIQIIGSRYGEYVLKSDVSFVEFQNNVVDEYLQKNKIRKIVYKPKDLRISDNKQTLYLARLKKNNTSQTEFIESKVNEFLEIIAETILPTKNNNTKKSHNEKSKTYIISDTEISTFNSQISEIIPEGLNTEIVTYPIGDSLTNILSEHENNLREAENVIVYNSQDNLMWLQCQLQNLKKIKGLGKENHFTFQSLITNSNKIDKLDTFLTNDIEIIQLDKSWITNLNKCWSKKATKKNG